MDTESREGIDRGGREGIPVGVSRTERDERVPSTHRPLLSLTGGEVKTGTGPKKSWTDLSVDLPSNISRLCIFIVLRNFEKTKEFFYPPVLSTDYGNLI